MHRFALLGDSNVYRFSTSEQISKRIGLPAQMLETTRSTSLELNLKSISKSNTDLVLVSSLGNIISDAGHGIPVDQVSGALSKAVTDYVVMITTLLSSKVRVLLISPTYRSEPQWFGTYLPLIKTVLSSESSKYPNVTLLPDFPSTGVDLSSDGVHFLPDRGNAYVSHLLSCVKDVYDSSQQGGSASSSIFVPSTSSTIEDVMILLQTSVMPKLDELTGLKTQVNKLEQRVYTRLDYNDNVTARLAEEQDLVRNKETSDRVVVVGYKCEDYPEQMADRKNFLADKFRRLIEPIVGEIVFDIYPKNEGLSISGVVPTFELKFHQSKLCNTFKQKAFRKVKEEPFSEEFSGVSFYPKVTVGTRVRVEILRAIAKKVQSTDESAYCPIFNLRPVLHIGPVVNNKVVRSKTLTFVDAIMRYRHLVSVSDFTFAYRQVGEGFTNSLRQIFLVLNDEDRPQPGALQPFQTLSQGVRGKKRKFVGARGGTRGGIAKRGK